MAFRTTTILEFNEPSLFETYRDYNDKSFTRETWLRKIVKEENGSLNFNDSIPKVNRRWKVVSGSLANLFGRSRAINYVYPWLIETTTTAARGKQCGLSQIAVRAPD